jgi:hypothetical protein
MRDRASTVGISRRRVRARIRNLSLERAARDSLQASRTSRATVGRAPRRWVSGFGILGILKF